MIASMDATSSVNWVSGQITWREDVYVLDTVIHTLRRSAEEQAALEERQQQIQERAEQQRATEARANELLVEHLDEKQRESYLQWGYFDVETRMRWGKLPRWLDSRKLTVRIGRGNTEINGQEVCITSSHHVPWVPWPDICLAKKLMAETHPHRLVRVAVPL